MSTITLTVPREYGYVIATTAATFFLGLFHGAYARPYRNQSKLWAPKNFAEEADIAAADAPTKQAMYLFNCAQRAHANYLENQPSTALALLLAGLRFPVLSTYLGIGWMIGRVIFTMGYTRADKKNGAGRMTGFAIQFPLQMSLWGLAMYTGFKLTN